MHPRLLAPLLLAFLAALASCVAPPPAVDSRGNVTVRQSSANLQTEGLRLFEEYKRSKTISRDPALNARLQRVAARLRNVITLPGASWEFVVFEDSSPNAFALPGGKVGVHSGLFEVATTDARLAAVVAHEIAHVTSNHAQDRLTQQSGIDLGGALLGAIFEGDQKTRQTVGQIYGVGAQVGIGLPFNRNQELEADRIGMIYMAEAGYDPAEAIRLWEAMAARSEGGVQLEFLRTHPLSSTRIRALQEFLPVARQRYQG